METIHGFHTIKSILNDTIIHGGSIDFNCFHTIKSILNYNKETNANPGDKGFHTIKSILNLTKTKYQLLNKKVFILLSLF